MANINHYEGYSTYLHGTAHRFRDINVSIVSPLKFDEGHRVQHSQLCHSVTNINRYKCHHTHFYASFHRFRD